MKHIHTFESFSAEALNEAVGNYTTAWARENEKNRAIYANKMIDLAEKAIKALPTILEDVCPGVFDTKDLGFEFVNASTAFVFANVKNQKDRIGGLEYGKIEDNKDFQKYFDLAGANLDSGSSRMFSSRFRLSP